MSDPNRPGNTYTGKPIEECMIDDCTSRVRELGLTVLCVEHYVSGNGPRHDAYADWKRELDYPANEREAFLAGWDARDPARCSVCRTLNGGGCSECTVKEVRGG